MIPQEETVSYLCIGSGIVYLLVFFTICWVSKHNDPNRYLSADAEIAAFFWPIIFPPAIVIGTAFFLGYALHEGLKNIKLKVDKLREKC